MIAAAVRLDLSPADGLLKGGGLKRAARIGLSRAAAPVKAAVVSHAEGVRRFGYLAKSIRIKLKGYPADRWVSVIGPSTKYKRQKGKYKRGKRAGQPKVSTPARYAHLVERGTKRSLPRPWLRPAYAATAGGFTAAAGYEVMREVEAELARRAAGR